jgi:GNAT superfamily N-acetyltransferase
MFEPHAVISRPVSGVTVRRRQESDRIFEHAAEPEGDFVAELDGEIVATGGFLTHYNPPFADLYMEVQAEHRRKGIGAFLVAEVVRECYAAGRVPSARCDIGNVASRATLTSAGMRTCGFMLRGEIGLDR